MNNEEQVNIIPSEKAKWAFSMVLIASIVCIACVGVYFYSLTQSSYYTKISYTLDPNMNTIAWREAQDLSYFYDDLGEISVLVAFISILVSVFPGYFYSSLNRLDKFNKKRRIALTLAIISSLILVGMAFTWLALWESSCCAF